jgi:hypothetical protein
MWGLCNLLTVLFKSIGLEANSVIIYNGIVNLDTLYILFWQFTEPPGRPWLSLLTKNLVSCQGDTAEWQFSYHAVCHFQNYLCDASLGLFKPIYNYGEWWRYYACPRSFVGPYMHNEPPALSPVYYDWPYFVPAFPHTIYPFTPKRYFLDLDHP